MVNQVVIAIDISGSTVETRLLGDSLANQKIDARLNQCERSFKEIDPNLTRHGTPSGDMVILVGSDLVALFRHSVKMQEHWQGWGWMTELPVRMSFGYGLFEVNPDGERGGVVRGNLVNLVCGLLAACEDGKVAVTAGVQEHLVSIGPYGFGFKLVRREKYIKGFGEQLYYETNGRHKTKDKSGHEFTVNLDEQATLRLIRKVSWQYIKMITAVFLLAVAIGFAIRMYLGQ